MNDANLSSIFQGLTTVLGIVIALYLVRHDKKIDRIDEKMEKKVDRKEVEKLAEKVDKKANRNELDQAKKEIADDCESKRESCSGSETLCDRIDSIRDSLDRKIDVVKDDICGRMNRNDSKLAEEIKDLWSHGNFHSHTNLPKNSEVIKRKG